MATLCSGLTSPHCVVSVLRSVLRSVLYSQIVFIRSHCWTTGQAGPVELPGPSVPTLGRFYFQPQLSSAQLRLLWARVTFLPVGGEGREGREGSGMFDKCLQ